MSDINTLTWVDGDIITTEKLQTMVGAIRSQAIDIPDIKIQDERNGQVLASAGNNFKLVAGCTIMPVDENSQIVSKTVNFASNSFTPGNAPIVIAQLATTDRVRSFCTVTGPNSESINPTSSGFKVWVAHQVLPPNAEGQPNVLTMARQQMVFWLAIGY